VIEVVDFRREFNQHRFERGLVLDPRPKYKTQGRPDA